MILIRHISTILGALSQVVLHFISHMGDWGFPFTPLESLPLFRLTLLPCVRNGQVHEVLKHTTFSYRAQPRIPS